MRAALRVSLLAAAAASTLWLTTAGHPTSAATVTTAASQAHTASSSSAQSGASPSAARRLNGKIAFVSDGDIYVMNPDGSNVSNLTPGTSQSVESAPDWSPDGAKIVFVRHDLAGEGSAFVMNADGSERAKLPIAAPASSPVWSPDGSRLAYSARRNGATDIYISNADGSAEANLTNSPAIDAAPTWSPDGARIAYVSNSNGGSDFSLNVMNADGGDRKKILDQSVVRGISSPKWSPDGSLILFEGGEYQNPPGPNRPYLIAPDGSNLSHPDYGASYDPAWSPDGKKLVFRTDDETSADIGVINTDGTGFVKFSPNSHVIDSQPAWQPLVGGENKIVFTSERDGNPEIYSMDADGANQINLSNHPARDATPVWSPDGGKIAFTSDRSGRSNIYVMDADGRNVRAVTNFDHTMSDYRVYDPAWSPDGAKLVFVGSMMGEVSGLVIVNADGSGERRSLNEGSTEVADPAWSPDGTRIAYVAREPSFNPEDGVSFHLFVVNADGSGKTRIASNPLPFSSFDYPPTASGPAWSPDGARIAYSATFTTGSTIPQIQHINVSSGLFTSITHDSTANTQPTWTVDDRIVYTNTRDGQREIYAIPVEGNVGRPVARLTQSPAADYDPNAQLDPFVPQRAPSTIQWRSINFRVRENGQGGDPLVVTRLGDLSRAASVDYETTNPPPCVPVEACTRHASERSDYVKTAGTLHFAPGEATKAIHVPLVDDTHVEGDQFFDLTLSNASGATLGEQPGARVIITDNDTATTPGAPNPIDDARFFVRMHYLDFLDREPEASGLEAWVGVWNRCPDINRDASCDRVTISSAFFRSQEFQMRGFFVYRFYRVSFNRRPTYAEFLRDTARISGQTLAEIDAGKAAFALAWTRRDDFRALYFGEASGNYVARLEANAGVALTGDVTRATLEADLAAGRRTHAEVLRAVAEHTNVEAAHYNEAFVTMQYFGYLKRDPEEEGFQNWLRVINRGDGYRVMVHGFVNSVEYRARFGTP